jgi:anti-anti-sigma factor
MEPDALGEGGSEDPGELIADARAGRPTVIYLRGEVDVAQAAALRRLLDDALRDQPTVVVDMEDTTFIDGSVIGALAQANARTEAGVRVRGAKGIVARVFHLIGMEHLLVPEADPASGG